MIYEAHRTRSTQAKLDTNIEIARREGYNPRDSVMKGVRERLSDDTILSLAYTNLKTYEARRAVGRLPFRNFRRA